MARRPSKLPGTILFWTPREGTALRITFDSSFHVTERTEFKVGDAQAVIQATFENMRQSHKERASEDENAPRRGRRFLAFPDGFCARLRGTCTTRENREAEKLCDKAQ
jgi:hypothetical protein